jgi:hypothetical protein
MDPIEITFRHSLASMTVELTDTEAWQLAQFLKRLRFDHCRELAEDERTAYQMIAATEKLRIGLDGIDFSPR